MDLAKAAHGFPSGGFVIYGAPVNGSMSSGSSMQGSGGRGVGLVLVMVTLLLLVVEFLLGMWVNLYVGCFPTSIMNVYNSTQCSPSSALSAHVGVGVLLVLVSLALVVWAARRHRPHLLAFAGVGFVAILVAAFAGDEFLSTGTPAYAFLMAVAFLAAFGAYIRAAGALSRHGRMGGPGAWSTTSAPPV
jgi:hypothetical protein